MLSSAQRLVFTGKQQVELEDYPVPEPGPGELLVRTRCSLMSTGTENIVFNRLFAPGTHWDCWVHYPFHPGYAAVGEVVAVGKGADPAASGQLVTHRKGHCSHALVGHGEYVFVPDRLSADQAVWFAHAKIGFHGALAAGYRIGDSLLVIGAGPIGQMSVRWACAAGVSPIIVCDIATQRLTLAREGGATFAFDLPLDAARERVMEANNGELPSIVIDSTGSAAVFEHALGLATDFGRVVILGDTGSPATQNLTSDVIKRGITIIGAHDGHNTPRWNGQTIPALFLRLAEEGRFRLDNLNTHWFKPRNCAAAYDTANTKRSETMGILFDWQ